MPKDLNNISFPELLTEYFFEKWLAPKTQGSYAGPVRRLRHYFGEDAYPGDISRRMVNRWRSAILSTPQNPDGIAATSWNNYARHLRALYNFGIEREYIPLEKNPFHGVAVRELQRKHKTLNASDIARAREALELCRRYEVIKHEPSPLHPAWFWSVVVEMFYHTGIRLNQLLTLQGRDINLRQRTFVASADGAKNGRESTLPITEALYPHLLTLMRSASAAGFTRGDQLFNVNRFSERHRRNVMDTWQVERFFNRLSQYSGGRITPHRFRHTLATDLMRSPGRDLHLTQAVCGHTDIRSTLGYVHSDIDTLRHYLEQRAHQ